MKIWDVASGTCTKTLTEFAYYNGTRVIDLSPDGSILATGLYNGSIFLLRENDGLKIEEYNCMFWVLVVLFSLDNRYLFTAGLSNNIFVIDRINIFNNKVIVVNCSLIISLAITEGSEFLLVGCGQDNYYPIIILDIKNNLNVVRVLISHKSVILDMSLSQNDTLLASASTNEIKIWNLTTGSLLKALTDLFNFPSVRFFPVGKYLVSGLIINFFIFRQINLKYTQT